MCVWLYYIYFILYFSLYSTQRGCLSSKLKVLFLNQISFLFSCDRGLAKMTVHCSWLHSTTRASQDFVSGRSIVLRCICMRWMNQKLAIDSLMKWMHILLNFRWVRKTAKETSSLVVSVCLSVCLCARKTSAPPGRIFVNLDIWVFFENLSIKLKFHYHLARIKGTLHEDQYKCLIIFRWILLRMKSVSDKSCRENQNTIYVQKSFFQNCVV